MSCSRPVHRCLARSRSKESERAGIYWRWRRSLLFDDLGRRWRWLIRLGCYNDKDLSKHDIEMKWRVTYAAKWPRSELDRYAAEQASSIPERGAEAQLEVVAQLERPLLLRLLPSLYGLSLDASYAMLEVLGLGRAPEEPTAHRQAAPQRVLARAWERASVVRPSCTSTRSETYCMIWTKGTYANHPPGSYFALKSIKCAISL